jgi:hypothetical protein
MLSGRIESKLSAARTIRGRVSITDFQEGMKLNRSSRRRMPAAKAALLTGSTAAFATALVMMASGAAFAAPPQYSYDLIRAASAGAGKLDVTVQLVRTSDGTPVTNAIISATKVDMASASGIEITGKAVDISTGRTGCHQFRIETETAGAWVLHLSAKVPGPDHVDRMFFPSVKWTLVRKIHVTEAIAGAVTFDAK